MQDSDRKVAIITGAGGGIGGATARRLAADGFHVVLSDLHPGAAEPLARELGGRFVQTNVTREEEVAALVDTAVATYGRLDAMINNAGIRGVSGSILTLSAQDWARDMAVLLDSVVFGMKHAARAMIAGGRGGAILSTSSIAAFRNNSPHPYTVGKTAVITLTQSVATELAPHGIRVNAVAPGFVPSPMTATFYGSVDKARESIAASTPIGYAVEARDIAAAFAFLAGEDGRAMTGQVLLVDGGMAHCPSPAGGRYAMEPVFVGSATLDAPAP
ncbi:SDR family oxidoreductase [Novosphingobium bradum]|uniref:SDR family oxidoreductase n=1 Tax=Novosphingobium bradum TaxID=1737444 RepID=A0ABV7IM20_9SPHN